MTALAGQEREELELGRRIRSTREGKGLSLRTVAEAASVSEGFLS